MSSAMRPRRLGKNLSQQIYSFDQIGVTSSALDIQNYLPLMVTASMLAMVL